MGHGPHGRLGVRVLRLGYRRCVHRPSSLFLLTDWTVDLPGPFAETVATAHVVHPVITQHANVHIPAPALSDRPEKADEDVLEDWNARMSELFEWAGMAAFGSPRYVSLLSLPAICQRRGTVRLRAYDAPDPFVALYTPPHPSTPGALTHIRWTGLLSPTFVQRIADTAMYARLFCSCIHSLIRGAYAVKRCRDSSC